MFFGADRVSRTDRAPICFLCASVGRSTDDERGAGCRSLLSPGVQVGGGDCSTTILLCLSCLLKCMFIILHRRRRRSCPHTRYCNAAVADQLRPYTPAYCVSLSFYEGGAVDESVDADDDDDDEGELLFEFSSSGGSSEDDDDEFDIFTDLPVEILSRRERQPFLPWFVG